MGHTDAARGWDGDELDLDAYLDRIAFTGDLAPTGETLRALQRAHSAAIPFENLEITLGRPVLLDLASLQDKMVRGSRGGYCFEHTRLFAAALERLGFGVTGLASRVRMGSGKLRAATHALLLVETEETADGGARQLCDIGFGEGPIEPIRLVDGVESVQGGWRFRLERHNLADGLRAPGGDTGTGRSWKPVHGTGPDRPQRGTDADGPHEWVLHALRQDGWLDLHGFTLDPHYPADYVVINHYISTHPHSPFVDAPVIRRTGPEVLHGLNGTELTASRPDGSAERRRLEPGEVPKTLEDVFGIALDPADATALTAYLVAHATRNSEDG
ncbi:arylamine N-acetyltransferase family protein [Streptosporangium carneum]|uniref:Arylamine n-acetyl transferase n=1 Tax=Streptosporangium carneum TaxID=47481 RepID=A0A9W6HZ82_9ACTN|nr:arylamine N-acetyltransferase [Streptosporangium carneum]GLK08369.1 putative arylamine n-acetyl transferase [Streptosporangium carneum]